MSMNLKRGLGRWLVMLGAVLAGTWGVLGAPVELVPASATWRMRSGQTEASTPDTTTWRRSGYDDGAWTVGLLPLSYGEGLGGTLITDMQNQYTTYFARIRFNLASAADVQDALLRVACDDGFVAWINGQEVARYNMPEGEVGILSTALSAAPEPVADLDYPVSNVSSPLRTGENVLAVQVFNVNLTSSDLVFRASLVAEQDLEAPVVTVVLPEPGAVVPSLNSVEVQFSEAVRGVDAADLTANGVGATGVTEVSPGQYLFVFANPAPGKVSVGFRAGHGITDLSSAARPLVLTNWSYTVDPKLAVTLRINEFMADNDTGIRDEDGNESDWIEIHNPGSTTVSLLGWSLTDDAAVLRKWRFPSLSIPARGYTLVWASGNNRTNPAAALHANFRLSDTGEFLALVSPEGAVVSSFAPSYPRQRSDVAYGRLPGSSQDGFLPTPTPRAANAAGGPGFAPDVEAVPPSGTYTTPISMGLLPAVGTGAPPAGLVIRYTLDGTLPGEASPVWAGPLALSNQAVQLRARAYVPGLLPGRPSTHVQLPLATTVARFTSDLPVIVIHDFNRGRPPADVRVPAYFQVFDPGTNGITVLTNRPTLVSRAGISARGSSTEGLPKVSLRVEFRDEFEEDRRVSFLGMPEEGDWVMYGPNSFEPVLIHNPLMHDLSRAIGRYSPRTRLCEVFLVTSGTGQIQSASYNGVYVVMERIEIGKDRVDLGSLEPENLTMPSVTGGYLMKVDRLDPGDSGILAGGLVFGMVEPKESELKEPARAPQLNYLRNHMDGFAAALTGPNYRNPVTGFRAYVDEGSWIDHHLLNTFAFNVDALRLSAYFGKRRGGKLEFGPLWDFDRALGSLDGRDANPATWTSTVGDRGTDFFNFSWWGQMFTDPEFFQAYIDRYQELRAGLMSDIALGQRVDELANQVRRAASRDWNKWGASPRAATYQQEINLMKSWMRSRGAFMDSQFVRPPALGTVPGTVARGSTVTLTLPVAGTVYYTTNGTDPRLPGGGIASSARVYSGPVVLQGNTRLQARTQNPAHTARTGGGNPPLLSTWSGMVSGAYITDPMPLEVAEIHFAPLDGQDAGPEDFEFIELRNAGATALDLTGVGITGAAEFRVSPTNGFRALASGGRGVVVADRVAFGRRYPGVTNILGEFSGRLANEGEVLTVTGLLGETVVSIPFQPGWLGIEPGLGHSLVPVREGLAPSEAALGSGWRSSAAVSGSPGRRDPATVGVPSGLTAVLDGLEVVLSQLVPVATAVEIQASSGLPGPEGWLALTRFPAGPARTGTLRVPASQGVRYFRVVSVD